MKQPKLLLIDDSDSARDTMQQLLGNENFNVISPETVSEAWGQIATEEFDVIVADLDMELPESGVRMVATMRQCQPQAMIVGMSDHLSASEAAMAVRLRVDFIVKEFDAKEVARLVQSEPGASGSSG